MAAGAIFPSPGNQKDGLSGQSFGKMLPNFRAIRWARASARSAKRLGFPSPSSLPVSITAYTCFGSASPIRF